MPSQYEKDSRALSRKIKKLARETNSELDTMLISNTLNIYEDSLGGHHFQRIEVTAKPMIRDFGMSTSKISLAQQYLLKYREAMLALSHNLKFIVSAVKTNEIISTKLHNSNSENPEYQQVTVTLDYLKDNFNFEHSLLSLAQNSRKKNCITIKCYEGFNYLAHLVLVSSKKIIEDLENVVDEKLLTEEDKKFKEHIFRIADSIMKNLKENKMNLDVFKAELLNERDKLFTK